MPCYRPITAFRSKKGKDRETGKHPIVFNTKEGWYELQVQIPCGQCIGCKQERSRQWAIRCVHEASLHEENCFITLTYSPEHLPPNNSLRPSDMVKFLKRLRKKFSGKTIRFFQCGEYGEEKGRAHHHILLFGHKFEDQSVWRENKKLEITYYRSKILEKLWPLGHSEIGEINFESAAYVARYVCKKQTGPTAQEHYENINEETGEITDRKPEYITMSRKPGIGRGWYEIYGKQTHNKDHIIMKGIKMRPPKYYDNIFDIKNPCKMLELKKRRQKEAKKHGADSTPGRLKIREACKTKQFNTLIRPIERA